MKKTLLFIFTLLTSLSGAFSQTIGPWDIAELRQVPNWKTTTVAPATGMTGILYESIDYLGNTVEVFAYYSAPSGTMPSGGWPAAIFCHGGGGTAYAQAVNYWNNRGFAAISMDLEGHYPTGAATPNPGPSRVGVWDDYTLPIKEQWYYHAIAQVMKAHSLIASFPEINANKIGILGASWGGTITSTVMGVDNRLAWAAPVYGAGYLAESDGHQGEALPDGPETEFVNANYDGRAYFNNVTFPTFWVNGTNDNHFALTCNQQSAQAVNGPATMRYGLGFLHSNLRWTLLEEMYGFANSVVNGSAALPAFGTPSINSTTSASVNCVSTVGLSSAQLLYTSSTGEWEFHNWIETNATISGNTISGTFPSNAKIIFFTATDSRGYMVSSQYRLTSDTTTPVNVTGVSLTPSSVTLTSVGATQSLSATVSPAGATNKSVTWSSSNSNVASVNSTGLVTAHGAGSATITATTNEGGFTDTSIITVSLSSGGGNNNLALNGTATQSSTANSGDASRAIDGNTNGAWSGGSVTHTASGAGNWWQVDLGSNKTIGEINVFGRTDACCIARLSDYTISVINSSGVTTYSKTYTSYPDPSVTTNAGNVQGKIVKIQLNVTSALSLAEVQVFEGVSCATFTRIEGETYNAMSGVDIRNSLDTGGGQMVGQIHNGDWCKYNNVDLTCATSVDARVASFQVGGDIEVRIDGVTGTLIGTISQGTTGGWQNWVTASANITQVSGVHDVYLVFKGGSAALFNFNWFEFSNNGQQAKSALTKSADQLNSNTNKPFLIYPNPATNKLNIELSNIAESTKINIFNSIGQMVISDELINEIHTVDISKLPGGMYVIKVSDKNNEQVLTQKFIKQ